MKNAEGVFLSLPARNERGESWREGKLIKNGLLSPTLSSFVGGEGEGKRSCAPSKLLAEQKWRLACRRAGHPARRNKSAHTPKPRASSRSTNNQRGEAT